MLEHGKSLVTRQNQLLLVDIGGSHNEYDTYRVTRALRKLIQGLEGEPFVELIDARELQGVTPEGYEVLEQYEKWVLTQNMVARAFVTPNQVIPVIAANYMQSLKKNNTKIFCEMDSAKVWLISELENAKL